VLLLLLLLLLLTPLRLGRLSLRSARVYDAILPMYSPSYVCVRVVVGPCLGLHMAYIFVCQNWTGQLSGGPNKGACFTQNVMLALLHLLLPFYSGCCDSCC